MSAAGSIDCRIYKVTSIASLTCGCLMGKGIEDEKHLNATDLQRKCNEKFSYSDAPVEPLSKEKRITGELKVMSYQLYCQNHFLSSVTDSDSISNTNIIVNI